MKLPQNRQPIAKRRLGKLSIAPTHTKWQAHAFLNCTGRTRGCSKQEPFLGEAQVKTQNKERYATLLATQTVPRTYVWHNRLTTHFVAITFANFRYEVLLSVETWKKFPRDRKRERGGSILATVVQQIPLFFNEWKSQSVFIPASRTDMWSNTTAEYDSRWQLAYVQKPKPLPGPCQPSHLQK